jgi:hypothetical protein
MQKLKPILAILAALILIIWAQCNIYLADKIEELAKCENQSVSSQKIK